jgi:hypothetical protein
MPADRLLALSDASEREVACALNGVWDEALEALRRILLATRAQAAQVLQDDAEQRAAQDADVIVITHHAVKVIHKLLSPSVVHA